MFPVELRPSILDYNPAPEGGYKSRGVVGLERALQIVLSAEFTGDELRHVATNSVATFEVSVRPIGARGRLTLDGRAPLSEDDVSMLRRAQDSANP
jgi:hypothetical protein